MADKNKLSPLKKRIILYKKKSKKHLMFYFSILILSIVFLIAYKNINLKNELKKIKENSNTFSQDELISKYLSDASDVKIISNRNFKPKLNQKKLSFYLENDLTIYDESDTNKIFHKTIKVCPDSDGNIYVHELMSGTIRKYNDSGEFILTIGRKGKGPGEFLNNVNWIFDENNRMHIGDGGNQRIQIFTTMGKFIMSIQLYKQFNYDFVGFDRDYLGNYYISFYDPENEKVIHKFDSSGSFLYSFGTPFQLKNMKRPIDFSIKASNSQGKLALTNDGLYYTQFNPYEIRKYSFSGKLKLVVFRENNFMPANEARIVKNQVRIYVPVFSTMIGAWKNLLINCIGIPSPDQSDYGCVIDIFDLHSLNLLCSVYLKKRIRFYSIDRLGRLYGSTVDFDEPEKIVRYKLVENEK